MKKLVSPSSREQNLKVFYLLHCSKNSLQSLLKTRACQGCSRCNAGNGMSGFYMYEYSQRRRYSYMQYIHIYICILKYERVGGTRKYERVGGTGKKKQKHFKNRKNFHNNRVLSFTAPCT